MLDSLKIKKLVIAVAVCSAAGTAVGAVIRGEAHAQAQLVSTESAAVSDPSPEPTVSESPESTARPADEIAGIVNILLIGTDEVCTTYDDQGRGDVTLLCSFNADSKTVKLISFERSTGVSWPGHGDIMLNSTYAYGGAELTAESISRGFDIALDGYVHVDFEGFSRIIDAMGGIDIYLTAEEAQAVTEDLWYEQILSEGDCHLDGAAALRYCRLRRIDDNWNRVRRQRNAIQAVINKGRSLRMAGIKKLAETALPLVDTNLSRKQLASLIFSAPKFAGVQAEQMTVPDRNRIWTYEGIEGSVTGYDRAYESERIRSFLYN